MRTKTIYSLLLTLFLSLSLLAQTDKETAITIGSKSISKEELQQKFSEFNAPLDVDHKLPFKDFLEKYLYNHLALEEARAQRLDTTKIYKNELESYRYQLVNSFVADTITEKELSKELYSWFDEELKINQVFIPFDSTLVLAKDTLPYYNKALELRSVAMDKGFDKVEKDASTFSFGVVMNLETETGELGWLKPFIFSYKLQKMLYAANLNEVSMPVRSENGYHVLQVVGRRPTQGNPIVEQVMFNFSKIPAPQAMKDSVYKVAMATYEEIESENNFQLICDEFAQAYNRGEDGCMLGLISASTKIPLPLIHVAFELQAKGQVSKPILTDYGWHILRLKDRAPLPTDREKLSLIKELLNSEKVFPEVLNRKRERMYKEFGGKINTSAYNLLYAQTAKYSPNADEFWDEITNKDAILFDIDGKVSYTIADFMEYAQTMSLLLGESQDKNLMQMVSYTPMVKLFLSTDILDSHLEGFVYVTLEKYAKESLNERSPKFNEIMSNLAEELLLTRILDQEIWTKSRTDVLGLQKTYSKNKKKYSLDKELFKGIVVFARDKNLLDEIAKRYAGQVMTGNQLKRLYNVDEIVIHVEEGLWSEGENRYVDALQKGDAKIKSSMVNFPHYVVLGKVITKPEEFSDVKNQVEADYQDDLEARFEKTLKGKYKVKVNKAVIKDIK